MPTTIVFPTALLADSVARANRVAPSKGATYDKAGGILLEATPSAEMGVIKATNMEVTYRQELRADGATGDFAMWRIPSGILNDILQSLPKNEGSVVEFIDRGDDQIRLRSGRDIVALNLLPADTFPQIQAWENVTGLVPVQSLAARIDQVSWACDQKSPVFGGVHIDGERMIAANQYGLASAPCQAQVEEGVTVPLGPLTQIIKGASDVRLASDGQHIYVALDAETQATSTTLASKFPSKEQLARVMRTEFLFEMTVHRQTFLDCINRLMALIRAERLPSLHIEYNGTGFVNVLTFDMIVPSIGRQQTSMDVECEYDGVAKLRFVPSHIQQPMDASRCDKVTIGWGLPGEPDKPASIRMSDENQFVAYASPQVD